MKAIFHHAAHEAPHITTFWFKPEQPFTYLPGQFLEWTVRHDNPDDRGERRWFTISSSPDKDLISLTTKFNTERSSTFKQALKELEPGQEITISEPMGDFVLPKDTSLPLTFVAGGIGVTPFHSMFEWLANIEEQRDIRFIYAVNSEDDIVFQDTFKKAEVNPIIMVTNPSDAWGGERGRLTADHLLKLAEPRENELFYLSGPEPMVEDLQKDLIAGGIQKHRIVSDFFHNYTSV